MATFPGFDCYGGATITRVIDGSEAEWIGCCAKNSAGRFGFYVFRNSVNIPILPFCTGRGSINEDGHWVAWDGSVWHTGALPGFVPIPQGAGGDRAPIAIPPGSPLAAIWTPAYTSAEVDSPDEIAIKLTKNNDQWEQLIALLKEAGVLA